VRADELFSCSTSGVVASVKKIKEKPDEAKRVNKTGIWAARFLRQKSGRRDSTHDWIGVSRIKDMPTAGYERREAF
jgi:hypothetical protein